MADTQHANLPDNLLHETKGASSALNNTWLKANGDGTTTFSTLPTVSPTLSDSLNLEYYSDQTLSTQGSELKVVYTDVDVSSPNGSVTVTSGGDITINEDGVYVITGFADTGRDTSAGVAELWFALRANGVQAGKTTRIALADAITSPAAPIFTASIAELSAGTVLSFHMIRVDAQGGNAGVYSNTSSFSGWLDSSSVKLTIDKLEVE